MNFDLEFFLAGKLLEQNIELVRCYIANELYTVVVQDFPDSGFPSHDLLKCHLMVRSSQPSDNQNPVYVLQK